MSCRLLGRAASRNSRIVYPQMEGSLCRRSLPGLTRSVNVNPPKAGILLCSPVYLSNSAGLWTLETFVDLSCCGDPCQSPLGQISWGTETLVECGVQRTEAEDVPGVNLDPVVALPWADRALLPRTLSDWGGWQL